MCKRNVKTEKYTMGTDSLLSFLHLSLLVFALKWQIPLLPHPVPVSKFHHHSEAVVKMYQKKQDISSVYTGLIFVVAGVFCNTLTQTPSVDALHQSKRRFTSVQALSYIGIVGLLV